MITRLKNKPSEDSSKYNFTKLLKSKITWCLTAGSKWLCFCKAKSIHRQMNGSLIQRNHFIVRSECGTIESFISPKIAISQINVFWSRGSWIIFQGRCRYIDGTFADNSYCSHNDKNMCTNQNNNLGGHCAQISSLIANKLNQTGTLMYLRTQ